jgi:pantoate--beta-alanine ligase
MNVITTVAEMQAERGRMAGNVGLVPTMGYLHEGHLSLVRQACADNDHVIVSIFVNPTQFGPGEDLARYPRDLDRDLELLERLHSGPATRHSALGTQRPMLVFVPSVEEMYPPGFNDWVEVQGPLTERLEGAHRPGHFRGVTTVVARLLRIIRPHRAYFGQKDAQQLRVIKRMVADIHSAHPEALEGDVEIVAMPTVREPDGLAMSSRNVYLSPEERQLALALPRALALARRLVIDEAMTDAETIRSAVHECIFPGVRLSSGTRLINELPSSTRKAVEDGTATQPDIKASEERLTLDYISTSDEETLEELETVDRPAIVLLAARVGATRLIDNTTIVPKGIAVPDGLRELMQADAALQLTTET